VLAVEKEIHGAIEQLDCLGGSAKLGAWQVLKLTRAEKWTEATEVTPKEESL
jgi:hypothetical protein